MKKALLLSSIFMMGTWVGAQEIMVASGVTKGKIAFNDFRMIDSNNPDAAKVLLTKTDKVQFDLNKETEITKICGCGNYIASMTQSLNGDIFYIPMHSAKLAMINSDAKTGTFVDIPNSVLDPKNQATFHARMTTAPDGSMYALNNNGSELLKISSNGTIQNLGAVNGLAEFAKKAGVETVTYGGDMLADAFGNIYVIAASGNVFKINLSSLSTDFLGKIKGLPADYTVNGAAVEKDGSVLLGTTSNHGLYSLDFTTLEAKAKTEYALAVYDMSSPYFLKQKELNDLSSMNSSYSLYPTVVKNSQLNIVSKSNDNSNLEISVWNINNKKVYSNNINIKSVGEIQVNLNGKLQPGVYVLKAVNQNGVEVINTKFSLLK